MKMARSITLDMEIWQDIETYARRDNLSLSKELTRLLVVALNSRVENERRKEIAEKEADTILEGEIHGKAIG